MPQAAVSFVLFLLCFVLFSLQLLGQWATMLAAMLGHGPANWWSLPPMKTKFVLASMHACSEHLLGMCPVSTGQSQIEAGDLPAWCSTQHRC